MDDAVVNAMEIHSIGPNIFLLFMFRMCASPDLRLPTQQRARYTRTRPTNVKENDPSLGSRALFDKVERIN